MISPGWTLIMPWLSMKDVGLSDLDKHVGKCKRKQKRTLYLTATSFLLTLGKEFNIASATLKEGLTSAPDYLTESELIEQVNQSYFLLIYILTSPSPPPRAPPNIFFCLDGKAWDWYRCLDTHSHQQYLPKKLCTSRRRPKTLSSH